MPPDRYFVTTTLAQVEETVRFLRTMAVRDERSFLESLEAKYSTAYGLMTAIEGVCGVAAHLIATLGLTAPAGAAGSFRVLHEAGILTDTDLRDRLAAMVRFRNLLVHRYWQIDYSRVRNILEKNLDDFGNFAAQVESFLAQPD